jgi:hypothetical protein
MANRFMPFYSNNHRLAINSTGKGTVKNNYLRKSNGWKPIRNPSNTQNAELGCHA